MIPFTLHPVVIPQSPDKRSWQERTDDELAGQPINAVTLARIDGFQHTLAHVIDVAGGVLSATDDQLLALIKLRAYRRQCVEHGGKDAGTSAGWPAVDDLVNIILSD